MDLGSSRSSSQITAKWNIAKCVPAKLLPNATLPNATLPNVTLPNATLPNGSGTEVVEKSGVHFVDEFFCQPVKSKFVRAETTDARPCLQSSLVLLHLSMTTSIVSRSRNAPQHLSSWSTTTGHGTFVLGYGIIALFHVGSGCLLTER